MNPALLMRRPLRMRTTACPSSWIDDGEVVEDPQRDEARRERGAADGETAGHHEIDEGDQSGNRDHDLDGDDRLEERVLQPVVVEPLHDLVGLLPFDRQRLGEGPDPAPPIGRRVEGSRTSSSTSQYSCSKKLPS